MLGARYKALLVGVSEFPEDPENLLALRGPAHDLGAMRSALSNPATGLVAAASIATVPNPTKSAAELAIHEFFSTGQRGDVLVFYYSGHGRLTREGKLFLCATDSVTARIQVTGIAASTLRDCMDASDAQTLVVLLDCCHSGAFRGGPVPDDLAAGRGTFLLTSSRARQLADDGDGSGPSPFTQAVRDALVDPASDSDGDGLITFDDVYRVAYERLAPRKQFPQRSTGEGTVALARINAAARAPVRPARSAPSGTLPPRRPTEPLRRLSSIGNDAAAVDKSVGLAQLVRDMHVRLLAGFAADAVVHAAAIAELSLAAIHGKPAQVALGDDASWLVQARRRALPFTGQICEDLDDDARRAAEIAERFAVAAGLLTAPESEASRHSAAWQASSGAPSALLRLDRANHRKALDDLMDLPRRVLVLLVDGEIDQGHDHFDDIMTWRLRSGPHSRWRDIAVTWPAPSPSLGIRLAMLLDSLASALGVAIESPAGDPATADGARAWAPAIAAILDAIDACRERLLLRHTLRWLTTGAGGDDALVECYARAIWAQVAARAGARVVVGLDLRRIERAGVPMTRAWRMARTELRAAREIASVLDRLDMPHGGLCVTLPELLSIQVPDLVDWLRADGGRKREVALAEADRLVSSTRGGRFDLIVERLTALNLDRTSFK